MPCANCARLAKGTDMMQPKTGEPCGCKPGRVRDNCTRCEGTGWRIDFAAIRAAEGEECRNS